MWKKDDVFFVVSTSFFLYKLYPPHLPICGKYLNPTLKNIKIHWSHQPLLMRIPVLLWLTWHGKQKSSQETFGEFKKASKATGDTWGEDGEIVKLSPEVTLFDGSEIPFPTTGWMYKTPINNGDIYHINWCMDFFFHQHLPPKPRCVVFFSHLLMNVMLAKRPSKISHFNLTTNQPNLIFFRENSDQIRRKQQGLGHL